MSADQANNALGSVVDPLGVGELGARIGASSRFSEELAEQNARETARRRKEKAELRLSRSRFSNAPDAPFFGYAYLLATAIGVFAVFASAELWYIPVLALAAYSWMGYERAVAHGTVFEFSDSIYYLGFTLSVGSLLASLDPFHPGELPDPKVIFHNFGLGMLTTLMGVALRTSLQTFHRLPEENLGNVQRRLAAESEEFVRELRRLTAGMQDAVDETAGSYREKLLPHLESMHKALRLTLENAKEVATVSQQFRGHIREMEQAVAEMTAAYQKGEREIVAAQSRLEASSKELTAAFEESATATRKLPPELAVVGQAALSAKTALSRLAQELSHLPVDMSPLMRAVSQGSTMIEDASDAATREVQAFTELVATFEKSAAEARQASLEIASPILRERLVGLEEAVTALAAATSTQRAATITEVDTLRTQVDSALRNAQAVSKAIDEIVEAVERKLERVAAPVPVRASFSLGDLGSSGKPVDT